MNAPGEMTMSPSLGRLLSVHRGSFGAGGWFWYVGGVALAAAVANAAHAKLAEAGVSVLLGVAFLVVPVLRWRQSIEVFENGFVWRRLGGRRVVHRAAVQKASLIQHFSKAGRYDEVRLELRDGERLAIHGMQSAAQLRSAIDPMGGVPGI